MDEPGADLAVALAVASAQSGRAAGVRRQAARLLRRARADRRDPLRRPRRPPGRRGAQVRPRPGPRPPPGDEAIPGLSPVGSVKRRSLGRVAAGASRRRAPRRGPRRRARPQDLARRRQDPPARALDKAFPDLSTRISPQIKLLSFCFHHRRWRLRSPATIYRSWRRDRTRGLLRALDIVAPGTALREGIDNIVHSRTGGLIVIGDPEEVSFLFSGGINLDIDYTPALLYQVAKMDGAIVLNEQATKIVCANVQLMPDPTILSPETGTRHRTAERVSKQTDALVVAISERRDVVSALPGRDEVHPPGHPRRFSRRRTRGSRRSTSTAPASTRSHPAHPARVRGRLACSTTCSRSSSAPSW